MSELTYFIVFIWYQSACNVLLFRGLADVISLSTCSLYIRVGPTCPFAALNNHRFYHVLVTNSIQAHGTHCLGCIQKISRINSHPYGRGILLAAASFALNMKVEDVEKMRLFWRGDLKLKKAADDPVFHQHAATAKVCTYPVIREGFCGKCDNSTSAWEGAFSEQFTTGTIRYGVDDKDVTKEILLIQMFRGSILSIDLRHFMECHSCNRYLKDVGESMVELMRLHEAACEKSWAEVTEQCQQLKPVVYRSTTTIGGRVLFPIVINVVGFGLILYAQIPPFYWALPAPNCERQLTAIEFASIVRQIATKCSEEETEFFEREAAAREWRDSVPQPVMIFPLFDNYKCCIEI